MLSSDAAAHYLRMIETGADGLADWWGTRYLDGPLDELHARLIAPSALANAARWYARHHLPVFPLTPGGKEPLRVADTGPDCCEGSHRRGCTDATTGLDTVARWWLTHPDANVGLATGHGFDVIDQDGPDGARSWARGIDWPPVIGLACTPRDGGIHRYIRSSGRRNGQQIAPGLDYRGRGGYVVAPPSVVNGRRYAWVVPLTL